MAFDRLLGLHIFGDFGILVIVKDNYDMCDTVIVIYKTDRRFKNPLYEEISLRPQSRAARELFPTSGSVSCPNFVLTTHLSHISFQFQSGTNNINASFDLIRSHGKECCMYTMRKTQGTLRPTRAMLPLQTMQERRLHISMYHRRPASSNLRRLSEVSDTAPRKRIRPISSRDKS